MPGGVSFDEEGGDGLPPVRPRAIHPMSTTWGAGINSGQAMMLLAVISFLAIAGSIYLIASALPPQPKLGEDVLRPGERSPAHRTL